MAYQLTEADFEDEPTKPYKVRSSDFDEPSVANPKMSLLDKANQYAGRFNDVVETSRLPMVGGGLLQGAGDIGASLANIPLSLVNRAGGTNLHVPHPNLGKYVDPSMASQAAFGAGQILPMLMGGGSAATALGKVGGLAEIPIAGKLARPVEGALAGAAIGEDKEGDRKLAAILGAGGNVALSSTRYAKKLSPEGLAKSILSAKTSAKQKYSNLYKGVFKDARKAGLDESKLRVPKIDLDLIKNNTEKKFYKSLEDFHQSPTLENAHWAQSDLGKFIRHMDKLKRNNPLTSKQIKAYEEAVNAQKKLRGSMFTALTNSGNKGIASKYGKVTEGYAKDVIPYEQSKPITDLQNKDISEKVFAQRIYKNNKFRKAMENVHPEIKHSEILNKLMSKIPVKTLGALGLGALGYDYYRNKED